MSTTDINGSRPVERVICCFCADVIAGYRRLAEPDARNKFWQIIHAVQYCHQQGIVHRDLKVRFFVGFLIVMEEYHNVLVWGQCVVSLQSAISLWFSKT